MLKFNLFFNFVNAAGEDDPVHPGFFRRPDIFLQVIDEEAFFRFQIICLKQILVNRGLRLCHLKRCGEDDAVEQSERVNPLCPFRKIGRCVGEQVDRNFPIFQLSDEICGLTDRYDMLRPAAKE